MYPQFVPFLLSFSFFCTTAAQQMSEPEKLERGLNLLEATSLNMTFMIGIGPFVVIPFIIRAMNGPQCILAWVVGAALALVDGCVWAELGAAMPQAGGTYVFLREAYGPNRFGRLMSFLFIWQTLFQGPLSISSGALGFADYSLYLTAKMAAVNAWLGAHPRQFMFALANYNRLVAILLIAVAVVLLYRRITAIGKISTILWIIATATIAWLIYGGATHFHKDLVFTYPAGAWSFSWIFFAGLGHASVQAIYSYLGYYNVCNLGGEMKNPERNIPRAIFLSILASPRSISRCKRAFLAVVPGRKRRNRPTSSASSSNAPSARTGPLSPQRSFSSPPLAPFFPPRSAIHACRTPPPSTAISSQSSPACIPPSASPTSRSSPSASPRFLSVSSSASFPSYAPSSRCAASSNLWPRQ